jgi:hypothetical protein
MKKETVAKRQDAEKKVLLEQLQKTPIVQLACERSAVGRTTYYRWRREDEQFRNHSDEAMKSGEEMINDLSESQLISLIKDKNFPAIQLWLKQHHPKYGNKVEVTARIKNDETPTVEQEQLVREVLGLELKK